MIKEVMFTLKQDGGGGSQAGIPAFAEVKGAIDFTALPLFLGALVQST